MILQKRIPKDFYKLFRTQNMQYYMLFLVALFEENMRSYLSLGLTEQECRGIISETIVKLSIQWELEVDNELLEQAGENEGQQFVGGTPAGILSRLVNWGWLKKDFDEKINRYVYSFPEYSQLYIELFQHLQTEDDSRERESILSIYSALYTFHGDKEKNNEILRGAVQTCRKLSQLLTNMQDGVRSYFEELSRQKDFIGIQKTLVEEINNSDSKKYAILTTTDSFYRYKEEIKELISRILIDNELYKQRLEQEKCLQEQNDLYYQRIEIRLSICDKSGELVHDLEREFDMMEQKYKKLIEQKSIFAQRALARMHYILQEGSNKENYLLQWIQFLNHVEQPDDFLDKTRKQMRFSTSYKFMSDKSFSNRRQQGDMEFRPDIIREKEEQGAKEIHAYIPKPLYTKKELRLFKEANMQDGKFVTTKETVRTMEDLEKLLFLWQEATENLNDSKKVELGQVFKNDAGMLYRELIIED